MTATPPVRVRFCPAPSGWLHVGGARTALFNWLRARRQGGAFVLRIEDTDAQRASTESAEGMSSALRWLGLDWDEGTDVPESPYGPYVQSARRPLHDAVAQRLLAAGHAYEAFETPEELQAARAALRSEQRSPAYKAGHRDLTAAQRQSYRDQGRDPVLRVRTPDHGSVAFDDAVRGAVSFDWADIGDFVIARADGSPTYLLANIVDDLAQAISLVARGEDLLSATPRQILMTDLLVPTGILDDALAAVGYAARASGAPPRLEYAHLPLLVGADRKKLSKRHGDVAVEAFRHDGYLPEVMLNFLALCGWSYDGTRERFSVPELIELFSFDRVKPSPAFFDTDKLRSLNGERIKELDDGDLAARLVPYFVDAGLVGDPPTDAERALIAAFAPLVRERSQTLAEAVPLVAFAFSDEVQWDDAAVRKWLKPGAERVLEEAAAALETVHPWAPAPLLGCFERLKDELGIGMGKAMQPVRVAVTGTAVSPPLPETLAVLPRGLVVDRIRAARSRVPEGTS